MLSGASGKIPDETGEVFRGGACAFTAKARQANLPDAPLRARITQALKFGFEFSYALFCGLGTIELGHEVA
jgi:hypothetical protein